ncbi:MAG: T9SS type A sorting domain-containing protein [Chitinophagaceae bacterium]|nr:T9SS type A sorting domain-containing protein [Chitinophagaceae bacterium]
MKTKFYIIRYTFFLIIFLWCMLFLRNSINAQICANPSTIIYGLTGTGAIYPIDVTNASIGTVVKSSSYSGNNPSKANGLAYNNVNGKFYYFKRNVSNSQEFVSYDPATATVSILATSSCGDDIHTGCITADGLYYYTIDIDANLNCYNIVNNTWTFITANMIDQSSNSVSDVIKSQNAGDIAFDGNGNLWIVTSDNSNYGVYKVAAPLPTTATSGLTAYEMIAPSSSTPTGKSIAGIAFNPSGQIFMATKNDNRLYRLENNHSLTFLGTFSTSDVGNDLTSCAFPFGVLPVTWLKFDAIARNSHNTELTWQIAEKSQSGFTIQHSANGVDWNQIGFITISDNDVEGQAYHFTHVNPVNGKNYYRIITKSESGKPSISQIKVTENGTKAFSTVSLWPNPVSGSLNVSSNESQINKVMIFDISGRLQLEKVVTTGTQASIDVSRLQKGSYILTVITKDGSKQVEKFVKQ